MRIAISFVTEVIPLRSTVAVNVAACAAPAVNRARHAARARVFFIEGSSFRRCFETSA
jgi:hypothetical protein